MQLERVPIPISQVCTNTRPKELPCCKAGLASSSAESATASSKLVPGDAMRHIYFVVVIPFGLDDGPDRIVVEMFLTLTCSICNQVNSALLLALVRHERAYREQIIAGITIYIGEGTNRQCVAYGESHDYLRNVHTQWEKKVHWNFKTLDYDWHEWPMIMKLLRALSSRL